MPYQYESMKDNEIIAALSISPMATIKAWIPREIVESAIIDIVKRHACGATTEADSLLAGILKQSCCAYNAD